MEKSQPAALPTLTVADEDIPGAATLERDGAALADLRHQIRNDLQTMTSLVSLFGDRVADEDARSAFVDLRARFEATLILYADAFTQPDAIEGDVLLETLARRIGGLYPAGGRAATLRTAPFSAAPRLAAGVARIVAELLISASRSASPAIDVSIDPRGSLVIRGTLAGPSDPSRTGRDLVDAIIDGATSALGGTLVRDADEAGGLTITIPMEPPRR